MSQTPLRHGHDLVVGEPGAVGQRSARCAGCRWRMVSFRPGRGTRHFVEAHARHLGRVLRAAAR